MGDGATYRRVLIEDARRDGGYLRTTWHPERGAFVVSTWRGEVCTGAVRVPVAAAGALARLLIDGLADVATTPAPGSAPAARPDLWARARVWLDRHRGRWPAASRRSAGPASPGRASAAPRPAIGGGSAGRRTA